jgi:hypothetical protein
MRTTVLFDGHRGGLYRIRDAARVPTLLSLARLPMAVLFAI